MVQGTALLRGTIQPLEVLEAKIQPTERLVGTINVPASTALCDAYEGEYTVMPSLDNDIVLETKNKHLYQDVEVLKIPQYEVSNEAGGITFIIGEVD